MNDAPRTIEQSRIDELRTEIDKLLDLYTLRLDDTPPKLVEAIRYSLLAGGKRLRPTILLLACQACGGLRGPALAAAAALEMLHTYSLVHDDLPAMDDDDLRRGQPTCHVRFGEATAILVGDALLTMAFEVMGTAGRTPEVALRCVRTLAMSAGSQHLIGGQFDDLAAENRQLTMEALEAIHRRKTARLFATAAELGGILAEATEPQITRLAAFGLALGLAFQIQDDLLDVEGHENRLGKRAQKDQTRGKSTYPHLLGVEASQRRSRKLLDEAIEHLESFGAEAEPLRTLARALMTRTH